MTRFHYDARRISKRMNRDTMYFLDDEIGRMSGRAEGLASRALEFIKKIKSKLQAGDSAFLKLVAKIEITLMKIRNYLEVGLNAAALISVPILAKKLTDYARECGGSGYSVGQTLSLMLTPLIALLYGITKIRAAKKIVVEN